MANRVNFFFYIYLSVEIHLRIFIGQLSYDGLLNFGKFPDMPFALLELPIFVVMGVVGGLTGAIFNQVNYHISVFRRR